jgi:hypothetical protein
MSIMMPIYTAQWEAKAARKDRQQIQAEETRLARLLCSGARARQPKKRPPRAMPALKKLVSALGYT